MTPKELVETALHVLVAWNEGSEPDPGEVELLKTAFPSSAHLPIDDLACQVIHDLSGRILPETEKERKDRHGKKDVA
ncbi:hypothetical protein SBA6_450003 [Candidatus Sulfopaludibacter sp. SbA6]|nr:hypothetical protein SBA6_450003 [Candidatus Sulfopaludibacter sp. SbA6]